MDPLTNHIIAFGALSASVINALSYRYIKQTYDTSQSFYFIISLDTFLTAVLCFIGSCIFAIQTNFIDPGPLICSLNLLIIVPTGTQPTLSLFVAIVRYSKNQYCERTQNH